MGKKKHHHAAAKGQAAAAPGAGAAAAGNSDSSAASSAQSTPAKSAAPASQPSSAAKGSATKSPSQPSSEQEQQAPSQPQPPSSAPPSHPPAKVSSETQAALERKLANRPTASHLVGAGVIKDGGRLAAAATALERSMLRNNLNHKLYTRPETEELEARGIARASDVAPALRSTKIALEHAITRDHLSHLLEQRPNPDELEARGVLAPGSLGADHRAVHVAPSLQRTQRELAHHLNVNKVGHLLEQRVPRAELARAGVLPRTGVAGAGAEGVGVAPALQRVQRTLERQLMRSNLHHALTNRPQRDELAQRGIWREAQTAQQQASQQAQQQPQQPQQQQQPRAQRLFVTQHPPQSLASTAGLSPLQLFHLTRLLLQLISHLSAADLLRADHKAALKDRVVDQDPAILRAALRFQRGQVDREGFIREVTQLVGR